MKRQEWRSGLRSHRLILSWLLATSAFETFSVCIHLFSHKCPREPQLGHEDPSREVLSYLDKSLASSFAADHGGVLFVADLRATKIKNMLMTF